MATEAYGMGIDNPDIKRIVQWLVPSSMTKVYQRGGRAGRDGTPGATFVIICEPKLIGDRSVRSRSKKKDKDDVEIQPAKLTDSERRGNLNTGLWELINTPDGACIRDIGLKHFNAIDQATSSRPHNDRCCSNCNKHLAISTERHEKLVIQELSWRNRMPWLKQAFIDWRQRKALEVLPVWLQAQPDYFMSSSVLNTLSLKAFPATSEADLRKTIKNGWADLHEYASEILDILHCCREMPYKRGFPVFDAWSAGIGKKSAAESARKRRIEAHEGAEGNIMSVNRRLVEPKDSHMDATTFQIDTQAILVPSQPTQPELLTKSLAHDKENLVPDVNIVVGSHAGQADANLTPGNKPKRRRVGGSPKKTREPLQETTLQLTRSGRIRKPTQKYEQLNSHRI